MAVTITKISPKWCFFGFELTFDVKGMHIMQLILHGCIQLGLYVGQWFCLIMSVNYLMKEGFPLKEDLYTVLALYIIFWFIVIMPVSCLTKQLKELRRKDA